MSTTQTGNQSPEQQQAYREQLDATIDSIDTEIEYFESTLDSHQKAIDRYRAWIKKYPLLAPILGPFVTRFVAQNEANINATQNNIATLQQQRTALLEANPNPVEKETIAEVKADEAAKHPRAEGPNADVPEDPNPDEV